MMSIHTDSTLWYGVRLNYLVWGASLGVFIVMETLWGERVFGW